MVATALFLMCAVIAFGVFYFRLHALPEHIAHKADKIQMEVVSLLCIIALFTHEHIFWIAGLILAIIDLPDFGTPLRRIAEKMGGGAPEDAKDPSLETSAGAGHHDQRAEATGEVKGARHDDDATPAPKKPVAVTVKERSHV